MSGVNNHKYIVIERGIFVVELEQYKYEWSQYKDRVEELAKSFNIEKKQERISQIENEMEKQDFWDDVKKSQEILKETKKKTNLLFRKFQKN